MYYGICAIFYLHVCAEVSLYVDLYDNLEVYGMCEVVFCVYVCVLNICLCRFL